MEWLYENPLPELLICGVLAGVCALAAFQKQRGAILIGTLLFLVLGVGAWFLDRGVQTDREAVEFALHDLVADFQRNDLEGALEHISPQEMGLRGLLELATHNVDIAEDYRITDVSTELSNENSIARTHFRVNATVSITGYGNQGRKPSRWEAQWQKTDEGWLMTDIAELDVVTGREVNRLDQVVGRWLQSIMPRNAPPQ